MNPFILPDPGAGWAQPFVKRTVVNEAELAERQEVGWCLLHKTGLNGFPIGNPTIADAVLDRPVHGANRIELKGESMRKLKAAKAKLDEAANT